MNALLFDIGPEPTERDCSPRCEHPADAQFMNANIFSASGYDLVCADCGATVAASFREIPMSAYDRE